MTTDHTLPPPVPEPGGGWSLRCADPDADLPLLAGWLAGGRASRTDPLPCAPEPLRERLRAELAGRTTRTCVAERDGEPVALVRLHRVLGLPLARCYPVGARDIAVALLPAGGPHRPLTRERAGALLRALVPALLAADPRCRRVVAAPDEDDTDAVGAFEAGGFTRVAESDLAGGTVVLLAVEPASVREVPTALDDMPH